MEREVVLSALYHAFRAPRRRLVIHLLWEEDRTTFTTREVAKSVASFEQDVPEQQATGEPYRNAYNALSQTHLPTLAEAGIIIYDPERQTIHIGPRFELAVLLLRVARPIVEFFAVFSERD